MNLLNKIEIPNIKKYLLSVRKYQVLIGLSILSFILKLLGNYFNSDSMISLSIIIIFSGTFQFLFLTIKELKKYKLTIFDLFLPTIFLTSLLFVFSFSILYFSIIKQIIFFFLLFCYDMYLNKNYFIIRYYKIIFIFFWIWGNINIFITGNTNVFFNNSTGTDKGILFYLLNFICLIIFIIIIIIEIIDKKSKKIEKINLSIKDIDISKIDKIKLEYNNGEISNIKNKNSIKIIKYIINNTGKNKFNKLELNKFYNFILNKNKLILTKKINQEELLKLKDFLKQGGIITEINKLKNIKI